MYKTIEIDRHNLTIMGAKFSDLISLESTANDIESNIYLTETFLSAQDTFKKIFSYFEIN